MSMHTRRAASPAADEVDTTSTSARLSQATLAIVLSVISVILMVTTYRMQADIAGITWPVGLIFGGVFQLIACVFLWAATGARMPLIVLGSLWGALAVPFAGRGIGGGILMPAVLGDQVQYAGWIVQGLGVGIPFLFALVLTLTRLRRLRRR